MTVAELIAKLSKLPPDAYTVLVVRGKDSEPVEVFYNDQTQFVYLTD